MYDLAAVLCVGQDEDLMRIRSLVLATRFACVAQATPAQLARELSLREFQVFVLCHTLPQEVCDSVVPLLRRTSPEAAILALHSGLSDVHLHVDAHAASLDGPAGMFAALERIRHNGHLPFKSATQTAGMGAGATAAVAASKAAGGDRWTSSAFGQR